MKPNINLNDTSLINHKEVHNEINRNLPPDTMAYFSTMINSQPFPAEYLHQVTFLTSLLRTIVNWSNCDSHPKVTSLLSLAINIAITEDKMSDQDISLLFHHQLIADHISNAAMRKQQQ